MDQQTVSGAAAANRTTVERQSDRELVVRRVFDARPGTVFKAWSQPELFRRWWMPRSVTGVSLVSCGMDVRTGGTYRLVFQFGECDSMAFHGRYLEVVADQRMVWTNEEGEEGAVTTVTFEEQGGKTLLTFHERYPSSEALEEAMLGSAAGLPEQLDQLDELLAAGA